MTKSTLLANLALTKGRFFRLTFRKMDGTEKTINGKVSLNLHAPKSLKDKYVVVTDRKHNYNAVRPSRVLELKCGEINFG